MVIVSFSFCSSSFLESSLCAILDWKKSFKKLIYTGSGFVILHFNLEKLFDSFKQFKFLKTSFNSLGDITFSCPLLLVLLPRTPVRPKVSAVRFWLCCPKSFLFNLFKFFFKCEVVCPKKHLMFVSCSKKVLRLNDRNEQVSPRWGLDWCWHDIWGLNQFSHIFIISEWSALSWFFEKLILQVGVQHLRSQVKNSLLCDWSTWMNR